MSFSQNLSKIITERYNRVLIRDLGIIGLGKWREFIEDIVDTLEINPENVLRSFKLISASKNPMPEIVKNILYTWAISHGPLWEGIVRLKESHESGPYRDYDVYTIQVSDKKTILDSMKGSEVWGRREEIKKFITQEDAEYSKLLLLSGKSLIIEW